MWLLPKTPPIVIISLIVIFFLLVYPIWNFWWIEKKFYRRLAACFLLIIALFFLGRASWPPSVQETVKANSTVTNTPSPHTPTEPKSIPTVPKPKLQDVALRFIYAREPALVIVNRSNSTARDIKWTLAIWNMDLADRNDPLPIPVSTFDWIRPHRESGPLNLFGSLSVAPLLKSGDHLFGSASIICPDCFRGRTYVVYIVYGQSGWYSEIQSETSGDLIVPKNFLRDNRETYFKELEATIPQKNRIPIVDPELKPFK